MKLFKKIFWMFFSFSLVLSHEVFAAEEADWGTESPFSIGIGAKSMALGNAMVAYPDDPSAFYWNPAAMGVVEQKCIGLSITTLFEGTQYNYIGYIHPTLSAGTFGFGIMRIGTGGITQYENVQGLPVEVGEIGYWWAQLTLAYSLELFRGFSMGAGFNAHRQVLGEYSTNGFGLDAGMHYAIPASKGLFRNFYFGCNIQNIISPRMKLGTDTETLPHTIRTGLAKVFRFNEDRDSWSFLFDLDFEEGRSAQYHLGSEFNWGGTVYLRVGSNVGSFVFGGGLRLSGLQLDYATERIGDAEFFPRSHRFSFIFHFGERKADKRKRLAYEREAAIMSEVTAQRKQEQRERIRDGLYAGRNYFENGEYLKARLEFSRVLSYDPDNYEAKHWLERTTVLEDSLRDATARTLELQAREDEKLKSDQSFIAQLFNEGRTALDQRDFQTAIEKWETALTRNPSDEQKSQLENYIAQAREELRREVNRLIAQAGQLTKEEKIPEAYKALERANNQARNNPQLQRRIAAEVRNLDLTVQFMTNYQTGMKYYSQRAYKEAAEFFKKALELRPDDERVKELHRNALAYSLGKRVKMKDEVKVKYALGLDYYNNGQYEKALSIWEEALDLDPYDVNVLTAISSAKEKLEMFKSE